VAQMMRRDIAEILMQGKVITEEQRDAARDSAQQSGKDLAQVLTDEFGVQPQHVLRAVAAQFSLKAVDLERNPPESAAVNIVPDHLARRHRAVPVRRVTQNGQELLYVAIADPHNIIAKDDFQSACKLKVDILLASREQIDSAIARLYPEGGAPAASNGDATPAPIGAGIGEINTMVNEYEPTSDLGEDAADESDVVQGPIIRIAHAIVKQAVQDGASDIHVEPGPRHTRVRYRIDGVLHEVMQMPRHIHPPLSSRYKIMSEMNIAERRVPQDGRIGINVEGKDYDLRVSCLPTQYGEKIVMRILDKGNVMIGLNRLGFFPDTLAQLERLFTQPNGMLLATGPTGAGKSTTLYSVLNRVNDIAKNILTVEDPVEYQLGGISQVQVNRRAGLSFSSALRSFMRQDPDIIMVGEIRDLETAELAIQASLTGHLVLSTLHTNDAPSSVTRMVDMGVEPFLVSATLIGALAQRLGRRICDKCKEEYEVPAEELVPIGYRPESEGEMVRLARGRGCDVCRQSGYKGRIGIYELMTVNEEIADLIVRRAPVSEVKSAARANGMKTLQDDGLRKVLGMITTPEEVSRVVFTGGH